MKKLAALLLPTLTLSAMLSCSTPKKESTEETATLTTAAAGSTMGTAAAGTTPAPATADGTVKLITLDPGHFHAALVQKSMYAQVDPVVHMFAPAGEDAQEHLKKINQYNARAEDPTQWREEVYTGPDYVTKMLATKPGNVVVLAGNNQKKTEYITAAVNAGLNVLADKPMAINTPDFNALKAAFAVAAKNNVLLYDIMTERYEITTMLQRAFSQLPEVFGTLQKGTPADPAITKESVHHFFKYVSGVPLKRPAWFFDVNQQGEGVVDVTTHLVDLVQWAAYPEQVIDYQKDIKINRARHWQTTLTPQQFKTVTQLADYPDFLKKDVGKDSLLKVYSNGEINYQLKGTHAKVAVVWNFEAPAGAGDTHYSVMKGTKAHLVIRQGKEQNYKPVLSIEPAPGTDPKAFETNLKAGLLQVQSMFPGVTVAKTGNAWTVTAPAQYHNGHEAHFGQVTEKYLQFLAAGKMPAWEVPNMLAKYYTTTQALAMAKKKQ